MVGQEGENQQVVNLDNDSNRLVPMVCYYDDNG